MIRIAFYHWLPISDNMLPEIEDALKKKGVAVSNIHSESDAISYEIQFRFAPQGYPEGFFQIRGRINQRGFAQNVLLLAPIKGLSLSALLNEVVIKLRCFLVEQLFDIAPVSVRNKLAVLNEGIVSLQEFESKVFDPLIDNSAKSFLKNYHFVAIMIDGSEGDEMSSAFAIPNIDMFVPASDASCRTIVNDEENCILVYSNQFQQEEALILDNVVFKFCALATYVRFVARVIVILKQARDHVIPLRRQLAIALQRNTEEHFGLLTRMKKYLTYVNIKLPVVQKVLNHLRAAHESKQFSAKVATFDEPAKIYAYPAISAIDWVKHPRLQPLNIISKISEDTGRLQALYDEDISEMQVISNELSQVLEGSLMSEHVDLSTRGLDASQSSLELDRGSKNRANALMVFNILVLANLGLTLTNDFAWNLATKLPVVAVLIGIAWYFTNMFIQRQSSYFRLIIPFKEIVPSCSLKKLIEN